MRHLLSAASVRQPSLVGYDKSTIDILDELWRGNNYAKSPQKLDIFNFLCSFWP